MTEHNQQEKIAYNLGRVFDLAMTQDNLTVALKALELQIKCHESAFKMSIKNTINRPQIHEWSDDEIAEALKEVGEDMTDS